MYTRILDVVARPVQTVVFVVGRCLEEGLSVERIMFVLVFVVRWHAVFGRLDDGVDEPELQDVHDDGEQAHGARGAIEYFAHEILPTTDKTTWKPSPSSDHVQLSSHSPMLKMPGKSTRRPTTSNFMVVRARTYMADWRAQ